MYDNLKKEIAKTRLSINQFALALGIKNPPILYKRLYGETDWTLKDMLQVQSFINKDQKKKFTLDYLFKI